MGFFSSGFGVGVAKGITKRLSDKNTKDTANAKRIQAQILAGEKEKEDFDLQSGLNATSVISAADDYAKAEGYFSDYSSLPTYLQNWVNSEGLVSNAGTEENKIMTISDQAGYNNAVTRGIAAVIVQAASNKNFDRTDPNSIKILLNNPGAFDPRLKASAPTLNTVTTSIQPDGNETVPLFKRLSNFLGPLSDGDMLRKIAKERGVSIDEAQQLMTAGMSAEDDPTFIRTLEEDVVEQLGAPLPEATLNYINTILPPETAADIKKAGDAYLTMDVESLQNAYYKNFKDKDGKILPNNELFKKDNITDYGQSIDTVMQVYISNENYDPQLVNRFEQRRDILNLPPLIATNISGTIYGERFIKEGTRYDPEKEKYSQKNFDDNTIKILSNEAMKGLIRLRISTAEPNLSEENLQFKIEAALTKIQG